MNIKPIIPETLPEFDSTRMIERPDGFYWRTKGRSREHGPFPTLLAAVQDLQSIDGEGPEPGETLEEAQSEIGIADWIDPDTGEPAEEEGPHLEEH